MKAIRAGATLLNLAMLEDVCVHDGRVTGVVVNRTMISGALPVDPTVLHANIVIDASGHEAVAVERLRSRNLLAPRSALQVKGRWMRPPESRLLSSAWPKSIPVFGSRKNPRTITLAFSFWPVWTITPLSGGTYISTREPSRVNPIRSPRLIMSPVRSLHTTGRAIWRTPM